VRGEEGFGKERGALSGTDGMVSRFCCSRLDLVNEQRCGGGGRGDPPPPLISFFLSHSPTRSRSRETFPKRRQYPHLTQWCYQQLNCSRHILPLVSTPLNLRCQPATAPLPADNSTTPPKSPLALEARPPYATSSLSTLSRRRFSLFLLSHPNSASAPPSLFPGDNKLILSLHRCTMSRTAKALFGASVLFCGASIWGVHQIQIQEREVRFPALPSTARILTSRHHRRTCLPA
jgi:hypothetical protein